MLYSSRTSLFVCLVTLATGALPVGAQQSRPDKSPPTEQAPAAAEISPAQSEGLTADKIAEQRKQVEAADLDDEAKKQALGLYDQAAEDLKRAADFNANIESDNQRVNNAGTTSEDIQFEIGISRVEPPADFGQGFENLQAELLTRTTELTKLKQNLIESEAAIKNADDRLELIAKAKASLRTRREQAEKQLQRTPPEAESPLVSDARRAAAEARLSALSAEEPALTAELARITAERAVQLNRRRADLAARRITLLEAKIAAIKQMQQQELVSEAAEKRLNLNAIPAGTAEAKEANQWVKRNDQLATRLISKAVRLEAERKKALEEDIAAEARLRDRVDSLGVVPSVGVELQDQLANLRDIREITASVAARESELNDLKVSRRRHEEKLDKLTSELQNGPENANVLGSQISILQALSRNETTYFEALIALDTQEQLLITTHQGFRAWLSERVLWIRSHEVFGVSDVKAVGRSLRWLLSPTNWATVPVAVVNDARGNIGLYLAAVLLFVALVVVKGRCRRDLLIAGEDARRVSCARFAPTLRAVWLTLLLAILWPMIVGFLGYRLAAPSQSVAILTTAEAAVGGATEISDAVRQAEPDVGMAAVANSDFSQAIGGGLATVALLFLLMNILRQSCRDNGLGEAHFSWDDMSVRRVRLDLRVIMVVLLPLLFVAATLHSSRMAPKGDSLERLCFLVAMLALGYFAYRMLHPSRGVFAKALTEHPEGWGKRTQKFWYPLSFGVPIALAVLATVGYFFTAYELSWRLGGMTCLVVGLVIVQALLVRLYTVHQRRLRLAQARARQKAMLKADASAGLKIEEATQDLAVVGQQTERLINTGLLLTGLIATWAIWAQVLPAVTFLNQWELWKTTREVAVERIVDGTVRVESYSKPSAVTALNLLKAVFLALATITAARNLPGLLEIVLLKRLPLEPALRYALRTVARYLIVIVGVTMALSEVGIGWGKVQWLVAGLTVGLGFGLQEIFANFVSGLIILFERPVRLGDIVTISEVSGTVSRIQIRATTITDWDRKEYIVPNKELVTGRLLNWTLSDKTSRIVIEVGVAYGTDTAIALDLLRSVAGDHECVLADPAPMATFEKFGDSTLNLVLRCFLPNLDNRLSTISELHAGIAKAFDDVGIEIAFPQLDVSVKDLPVQTQSPSRSSMS